MNAPVDSARGSLIIAVDAMSGDRGPDACVAGAVAVLAEEPTLQLLLVGDPAAIDAQLARSDSPHRDRISVVATTQVVAMDEAPREAIRRKKDSSMRRAIELVRSGEARACVSAGNTGALMAIGHFVLGMIEGIERPAILATIPSQTGHTLLLDVGANSSASVDQLVQFALMGSIVSADIEGIERPRIGLLNIGSEDIKGHDLVRAAHERLQSQPIHYVGFVEGDDICGGAADVVVTDGFTGNVALKSMEGLARLLASAVRHEFTANAGRKLAAMAAAPALAGLKRQLDPRRHNGASMVGLSGIVIKSHGSADAVAFSQAVRVALAEARNDLPAQIGAELKRQVA
jgi:glycerol-3-phosphate acyltransferase PlsX